MRSFWLALFLAATLALALPLAASAIGLDVEAHAGGGLGIGLTNNSAETGSPRLALQGGIVADLFLFNIGPVNLGLSTGLEYDNMNNHGSTEGVPSGPPPAPTMTVDSDNNYVYLLIPFAITSRTPLSQGMDLSVRLGGFYGFFLGGKVTNTKSDLAGSLPNVTLDSSNTPGSLIGLHFSGGVDFALGGGLFLSPSLLVDMGLTNINGTSTSSYTFYNGKTYLDSLGSITLMVGIKYNVL